MLLCATHRDTRALTYPHPRPRVSYYLPPKSVEKFELRWVRWGRGGVCRFMIPQGSTSDPKMHPRANNVDMGEPIRASPPIQIEPKPSHAQQRKYISFYAQSILIWSLATCSERHGCADRPNESGQRVLSPPMRSHQVTFTAVLSVVDDSYGSKVCCPTPRLQGDSLRGGPGESAPSTRLCGVPP